VNAFVPVSASSVCASPAVPVDAFADDADLATDNYSQFEALAFAEHCADFAPNADMEHVDARMVRDDRVAEEHVDAASGQVDVNMNVSNDSTVENKGQDVRDRAVPAPFKLRDMFRFTKKNFDGTALKCNYCDKRGHVFDFCPVRPHIPDDKKKIEFVERLLAQKAIDVKEFTGLSLEEAKARIEKEGAAWNQGNPWAVSEKARDRLRKELGYWKAIGASKAVVSWLGYGLKMRFATEPSHFRKIKLIE